MNIIIRSIIAVLPTLIGVLDLVRAGGRIVDFKSTGKTPDPEDAVHQNETQLSCYSVLYREATGHREAGRELHHLVKTKTPKLVITELGPMSEMQQVRLFRMMGSYVEGLAREDFVASPGLAAGVEPLRVWRGSLPLCRKAGTENAGRKPPRRRIDDVSTRTR